MAELVQRRWESDVSGLGVPRRDRRSCEYEAYLPDLLRGRSFSFTGETAADLADAEAALLRLDQHATALIDTEALARILLRSEAVASSGSRALRSALDDFSTPS